MKRLGGPRFFNVLPLRLTEFDLSSLSYAQDSRSWLLTLVSQNMNEGANLDFFVQYFLPQLLKLDKMRDLESKQRGSEIKIKKYSTLIS